MVHGIGKAAGVRGARWVPVRLLPRPAVPVTPPEPAEVVLSVGYAAPAEAGVATGSDQLTRVHDEDAGYGYDYRAYGCPRVRAAAELTEANWELY